MALTQRLELRQGQTLVMTPQLQQAIKLLQMSNHELQEFVEEELEKNPLLERGDADVSTQPAITQSEPAVTDTDELPVLPLDSEVTATLNSLDTDLGNIYADEARVDRDDRLRPAQMEQSWGSVGTSGSSGSFERDGINFENVLSQQVSLSDFLEQQLSLSPLDPAGRIIGHNLIGMIDEAGYLGTDTQTVAEMLGTSTQAVEETLAVLQTFDPPGILARDLKECLSIQLKEADRFDPAMQALVENLDLLAKRDFKALKRVCGVDIEDIYDMVAEIRNLDPKPGYMFGETSVQPVIPDVIVRAAQDGTWIVELNNETLPKVLVNNQYLATVTSGTDSQKDQTYISECHSNATWLVKSLEQRARTILAVSREIVRQQDAFLVNGIESLKPLNLRNISEAIEMHESTVSRVTSNKYIETPRGIFELKYFFTTAIASTNGEDEYSAESIRHQIRNLIDAETVDKILSDDAIVASLRDCGIEIARRTVAKYRESMRIPSSVQRRREKKAAI